MKLEKIIAGCIVTAATYYSAGEIIQQARDDYTDKAILNLHEYYLYQDDAKENALKNVEKYRSRAKTCDYLLKILGR